MKQWVFVTVMLLLMLPLIALPILQPSDGYAAGHIVIGDIRADIYTTHGTGGCGCCPSLWGGGIAVRRVFNLRERKENKMLELQTQEILVYDPNTGQHVPVPAIGASGSSATVDPTLSIPGAAADAAAVGAALQELAGTVVADVLAALPTWTGGVY